MDRKEWLEGLKAGDRVALFRSRQREYTVTTVVRATKAMLFTSYHNALGNPVEVRYRRSDGYEVNGDKWFPTKLEPLTPEIEQGIADAAERSQLLSVIRGREWKSLPTEALRQVAAILTAHN